MDGCRPSGTMPLLLSSDAALTIEYIGIADGMPSARVQACRVHGLLSTRAVRHMSNKFLSTCPRTWALITFELLLPPCALPADLQDHVAERTNSDVRCLLHVGKKLTAEQMMRGRPPAPYRHRRPEVYYAGTGSISALSRHRRRHVHCARYGRGGHFEAVVLSTGTPIPRATDMPSAMPR